MAKILKVGLNNPKVTDIELAEPFGYMAPFSARHRAWLNRSGIIEKRLPLKLTEFGKVLVKHDPKLQSEAAKWFIHHELTSDPERSETWHFFIKKFLPRNKEFSKEDLFMGLVKQLSPHSEQHFGMMSSMNKVIVRKLIDCYLDESALGSLGFLLKKGSNYVSHSPKALGPWMNPSSLAEALK